MRKTMWKTPVISDLAFIAGILIAWILLATCWGGFPK